MTADAEDLRRDPAERLPLNRPGERVLSLYAPEHLAPVLMFKVLLLQAMHTLSDERCEYLIKGKRSSDALV